MAASSTNNNNNAALNPIGDILDLFLPVGRGPGPVVKFTTSATMMQTPIYYLSGATPSEQMAVMTALTLCGKSIDTSPTKWQTLVSTWSCIVFPELVALLRSSLNTNEYRLEPLDTAFVKSCYDAIKDQSNPATVGDKFLSFPPGLPAASAFPINVALASTVSLESSYQYYAMLVYIMGKSLNPESRTAIATRRPEALMRKGKSRRAEYILQGDGRILTDNYGKIQGGWIRAAGPRKVIVNHLAALYASPASPEILDAIVVNMDMLRHSGQTYIVFIHELVTAHPWAVTELHPLRASWRYYSRIVHILAEQPRHLVPFYKLMMQDLDKDVRRREIEPLIAVATFYAGQTRPKMYQYQIDPGCGEVVRSFAEMAATKGYTLKQITNQATTETTAV
jgi:hypothetical protein